MKNTTNGLTGEDLQFWERVFHDLLPVAIQAHGWRDGNTPITSGEARAALAASWADYAVREWNIRRTQAASDDAEVSQS